MKKAIVFMALAAAALLGCGGGGGAADGPRFSAGDFSGKTIFFQMPSTAAAQATVFSEAGRYEVYEIDNPGVIVDRGLWQVDLDGLLLMQTENSINTGMVTSFRKLGEDTVMKFWLAEKSLPSGATAEIAIFYELRPRL